MKKTLLLALLASATLSLTVSSCQNPDVKRDEDIVVKPLPPLPAEAAGQDSASAAAAAAKQEVNAINATEAIKKMQPQM